MFKRTRLLGTDHERAAGTSLHRLLSRVSTGPHRQGRSRLGLEAQQKSVRDYLNGGAGSW